VDHGVNCPEALIDPDLFFAELVKRNMTVHYKEKSISYIYVVYRNMRESMPALEKKIIRYLEGLTPDSLGLREIDSIEILKMIPGSYNLNFHVRAGQKDFIFRVNIDQQSGLSNQVEHEFNVLKFLEGHRIAPQAFLYDDSRKCFDFDILIEEYLEGPPLSLQKEALPEVAELLTRLHGLDPGGMPFVIWQDPLAGIYELTHDDLAGYETALNPDTKTISLAKKVLAKSETLLNKQRHLFQANSLTHTDLCCENFVKTASGLRLIDWEKPRVDDGTYDICCFLSEPVELYNSREVLNSEERQYFIDVYAGLSGKNPDHLMEKVNIREPLISLHWILWAATMLSNLREQRTSPDLVEAHEDKITRYERVANPENIERLIEKY
jgi:thiamine kinase-like enzyme